MPGRCPSPHGLRQALKAITTAAEVRTSLSQLGAFPLI